MRDPGDQLRAMLAAAMERPAPKPLTRRERAAMVLGLCMLRRDVITSGGFTPWASDMADVLTALRFGGVDVPAWDGTTKVRWRILLALYLRARLRAEGREEIGFGRWACVNCGSGDLRHPWVEPGPRCRSCGGNDTDYTCRITPLWQSAPETRR